MSGDGSNASACASCDCLQFVGNTNAGYCGDCGHARSEHRMKTTSRRERGPFEYRRGVLLAVIIGAFALGAVGIYAVTRGYADQATSELRPNSNEAPKELRGSSTKRKTDPDAALHRSANTGTPKPSEPRSGDSFGFRLPTGNIVCNNYLTSSAGASETAAVECVVFSSADCTEGQNWWSLPANGHGSMGCTTSNIGTEVPVLKYGDTWRRGGVVCTSEESGLRCSNRSGESMTLSRDTQGIS